MKNSGGIHSRRRESLCNAVYRKGYTVREPIEVRILPDRIEIVSNPGAGRSISTEHWISENSQRS